jgi:superfamily II DNA/RNA helicase
VTRGHDVLIHAHLSTEKTLPTAIAIAVLQQVDASVAGTQTLVLVPTRELAALVHAAVIGIGKHMGVQCRACVDGAPLRNSLLALRGDPHVVVATPRAADDMVGNRHACPIRTSTLRLFCLYEADALLGHTRIAHTHNVMRLVPRDCQALVVAAAIPPDVLAVALKLKNEPVRVRVERGSRTFEGISEFYTMVPTEEDKVDKLCELYEAARDKQLLVFCNSRREADTLTETLQERGLLGDDVLVGVYAPCHHLTANVSSGHESVPCWSSPYAGYARPDKSWP